MKTQELAYHTRKQKRGTEKLNRHEIISDLTQNTNGLNVLFKRQIMLILMKIKKQLHVVNSKHIFNSRT